MVIISGGVVDIDALQMAWSQRVLSTLLDTNASRFQDSNKGLGMAPRHVGGRIGAGGMPIDHSDLRSIAQRGMRGDA